MSNNQRQYGDDYDEQGEIDDHNVFNVDNEAQEDLERENEVVEEPEEEERPSYE